MDEEGLDSDLTGEAAVAAVQSHVLQNMKWAFRSQPVLDYGIDAQVEIKVGRKPTGHLLALQIKGGPSWFMEPVDEGWIFRPSPRHVSYWLGHILPVIVVLVNLEEQIAYWEQITCDKIISTGKGYKITIPNSQTLGMAKDAWSSLVEDNVERASENYRSNLRYLPPSVADLLDQARSSASVEVALLALELAKGRANPKFTAQTLVAATPSWLGAIGALGWRAVASYSSEHGLNAESVAAYKKAIELEPDHVGRLLAVAGIQAIGINEVEAHQLLDRAMQEASGRFLARIGQMLLGVDDTIASPIVIPADLDLNTREADLEPVAQEVLAINAQRMNDDSEAIKRYHRAVELRPTSSSYMLALAKAYIRRANTDTSTTADVVNAKKWSLQALEQRRRWDGDSAEVLQVFLQSLAIQGDLDQILRCGRVQPFGEATVEESRDVGVAGKILYAAKMLHRDELIAEVISSLGDQPGSALLTLEFASDGLAADERVKLWWKIVAEALENEDYENVQSGVLNLAFLGVDASSSLDGLIQRSIISSSSKDLAITLYRATTNFDREIPRLQVMADQNPIAAEFLVDNLAKRGRFDQAMGVCSRTYARLHTSDFLIKQVQILVQADRREEAESAALRAVVEPSLVGFQKAKLYLMMAQMASQKEDWALAERYLRSRIDLLDSPDLESCWNLVRMQINQRKGWEAGETVLSYKLKPDNEDEARCWLNAFYGRSWDNHLVEQGLTLANRFADDVELSEALLTHIIFSTRASDEAGDVGEDSESHQNDISDSTSAGDARFVVDPGLRRQAFEALAKHSERHGEATSIRMVPASPEDLIAQVKAEAASRDLSPLRDALDAVFEGRLPVGVLVPITRRSYALINIQRMAGVHVAVASADEVHELELDAARLAFGHSVVTEASAILLSESLIQVENIRGRFADILLPQSSRDDIARAAMEARSLTASSGSIGWSEEHNQPIFYEYSHKDRAELWARAELLETAARRTTLAVVGDLTLFEGLDDLHGRPWLAPIQLAHERGLSLWSDDVVLRHLARSVGVSAFGTLAAIEALIIREMEISHEAKSTQLLSKFEGQQAALVRAALEERVVDIPADLDDIVELMRRDKCSLDGPAVVPLVRPAWWQWRTDHISDLKRIFAEVSVCDPELLPGWQIAAMRGLAATSPENADLAAVILAFVALLGFGDVLTVDVAREGLKRAAVLADALGVPDPHDKVVHAARMLSDMGRLEDPMEFVSGVLRDRG